MRESLKLVVGQQTDVGMKRQVNEDSLGGPERIDPELVARKGYLYVVADGMGGQALWNKYSTGQGLGKWASELAVKRVIGEYYSDPSPDITSSLRRAVQLANAEIYQEAQVPAHAGAGTTLVAAVLRGNDLFVANVGDSRAYLIRRRGIRQITRDHSWVAEQLEQGLLTEVEARHHPHRNIVTRSLGGKPEVEVDVFHETLREGDAVLLCSDGLTEHVRDRDIYRTVVGGEPQVAADRLVDLANQLGGGDNVSVVVIRAVEVPSPLPLADTLLEVLRNTDLGPISGGIAIAVLILSVIFWAITGGGSQVSTAPSVSTPSAVAILTSPIATPPLPTAALSASTEPAPTTVSESLAAPTATPMSRPTATERASPTIRVEEASPTSPPSPSVPTPFHTGGTIGASSILVGIRHGFHPGYERVVFEVQGSTAVPYFEVREITPGQATYDPSWGEMRLDIIIHDLHLGNYPLQDRLPIFPQGFVIVKKIGLSSRQVASGLSFSIGLLRPADPEIIELPPEPGEGARIVIDFR